MIEPVIECPHCHKEIKLTESLAAPLVEATRLEFERKLAEKDAEVDRRETELRAGEQSLATARQQIDAQIEEGIRRERLTIAAEESQKARRLASDELEGKARELAELQQILEAKDGKLAEAQKAQAELIRKQRELDDAKARTRSDRRNSSSGVARRRSFESKARCGRRTEAEDFRARRNHRRDAAAD